METNYVDARTPEEKANEPKSTITYSSAVETPSIQSAKDMFSAQLLDGDKMEDCGKAMIVIDEDFIQVFENIITTLLTSRENEMIERLEEYATTVELHYDAFEMERAQGISEGAREAQTIIKEVMQG
jgi:hypothetical protein